jgi:hypothetical protein
VTKNNNPLLLIISTWLERGFKAVKKRNQLWVSIYQCKKHRPRQQSSAPYQLKIIFVGDTWLPGSEEDNEEQSPSSPPFSIADKWIAESDEIAPLSRAPSPEGIGRTWLCDSDDDVRPASPSGDMIAGSWECETEDDETDIRVGHSAPRSVASDGSLTYHICVTFLTLISRHCYLNL